jgi:hypothetical protein
VCTSVRAAPAGVCRLLPWAVDPVAEASRAA